MKKQRDDNDRLRDGTLPRDPEEDAVPFEQAAEGTDESDSPTPLGRPPVPRFPVHLLPSPLREFAASIADTVQVPVDVPALLSLAAVAACVQRRYVVEVVEGYVEPLSLFVAVVLESGERKSACLEAVTRPIAEWERSEARRLGPVILEEREARAVAQKRRDRLVDQAAKAKDAEEARALTAEAGELSAQLAAAPEPVFPRALADDVTSESLAHLMSEQGERMAVFSAEGGIFETMAGRYSSGVPNLDVFLKGHAADLLRVDRRSGPPVVMDAPALTIGLAVQPDVLRALADKPGFRGRGLLARFVFALPVSLVGYRHTTARSTSPQIREEYSRCIQRLLHLKMAGADEPIRIPLTPDALAIRTALASRIEVRLRAGADLAHVRDWANKAAGLAVRMAGLMHLAAGPAESVDGATMQAAADIVEAYAIPHALAAFGEMGVDPDLEAARAIMEWVDAHNLSEVSVREVFNAVRGQTRFRKVEAVQRGLDVAEQCGHVWRVPVPPSGRAGRPPSPRYRVRPQAAGASHNPQNPQNSGPPESSADNADYAGEDEDGQGSGERPQKRRAPG